MFKNIDLIKKIVDKDFFTFYALSKKYIRHFIKLIFVKKKIFKFDSFRYL